VKNLKTLRNGNHNEAMTRLEWYFHFFCKDRESKFKALTATITILKFWMHVYHNLKITSQKFHVYM